MPTPEEVIGAIERAATWDERVALLRRIPEQFGTAQQAPLYASIAQRIYVSNLAPDFAYVHWREDYELEPVVQALAAVVDVTRGLDDVRPARLAQCLSDHPGTLLVFRNVLGFTTAEFAAATKLVATDLGLPVLSKSRAKSMESGRSQPFSLCATAAELVHRVMTAQLFMSPSASTRRKVDKPDTAGGWETVRRYLSAGVPYATFLHQRNYGGAFRQLLDATSTRRGGEEGRVDAVADLFDGAGVRYLRTGSVSQELIAGRFGLTVRPAPDFVVYDGAGTLRALLECKGANDGGTARDKAARFRTLRGEATRLGGIPLFAVLSGLGWGRTSDALGPVVRDTDGRTFTLDNLPAMLTVQPFSVLTSVAGGSGG